MIAARHGPPDLWQDAACALAQCDPDGTIRAANPRLATWCGTSVDALAGRNVTRVFTRASALLFEMQLRPRLLLGERIDGALLTISRADGRERATLLNAEVDADGLLRLALVSVGEREAYEASLEEARREAETAREALARSAHALAESEALVRAQFEATPLPTFVWRQHADGTRTLTDHNTAGRRLLDAVASTDDVETSPPDHDVAAAFAARLHTMPAVVEALGSLTEVRDLEMELAVRGVTRRFTLTVGPLPPDRCVMTLRDVSDEARRRELEQHAARMQSLGELVAGIAHEFNNALATMRGNLELLEHDLADLIPVEHDARDDLRATQQAAERASGIVAQLLAFSGRRATTTEAWRNLDINSVLSITERMLRPVLGRNITWSLDLAPALPPVLGSQDLLVQVVTNLVLNARDAMLETGPGGTLTIGSTAMPPGPQAPTSAVQFFVQDTGPGMSDETRRRAFEPFFSTKPVGRGTGLGLSTVFGIVRDHHGHIDIDSAPGCGTCVRVTLPAVPSSS